MNPEATRRPRPSVLAMGCHHRADVSGWCRRAPVIVLALAGLLIASTLTLFQVHAIGSVWEPFFGDGSRHVLTSSVSRALPIPDASLGAAAYAAEAILEWTGGARRALDTPWLVIAAGLVAAGLGLAAFALVALQALVVGAFCTLCLTLAAVSLLVAGLLTPELRVAARTIRTRRQDR